MRLRYFIGFIITIGLIILLIFLIFGGSSSPKVPKTQKTLSSYATTDASVSMTIDGPVNADQDHQQIQISVSNNTTTYSQIQGYQGHVVKQQTYANNVDAYTAFLLSLQHAGFTEGNNSSDLKDERGYCPLGDRYIFELQQDGQVLERYWATNCGGTKTFEGSASLVRQLFENQVPDFNSLTEDLNLSL